jgi:hypothetical protein
MRTNARLTVIAAAAIVAMGAFTLAAPQQRSMMQTPPMYNVASEVTLSGTIDDVTNVADTGAAGGGIHVTLKTTTETVPVHLGPAWFMTQQKYVLAKGDAVTVIGSRVKMGAADAVLAREIKKGEQTMTFRDARGFPKWSGRGRG